MKNSPSWFPQIRLGMKFAKNMPRLINSSLWDSLVTRCNKRPTKLHKTPSLSLLIFQSKSLLEKHLKIGEGLSVEDLLARTSEKGGVQMVRGVPLQIVSEENDGGKTHLNLIFLKKMFKKLQILLILWNGKIFEPKLSDQI